MRTILILMASCLFQLGFVFSQPVTEVFPFKWKVEIGQTSYRSNIVYYEAQNAVAIGSNGNDRGLSSEDEDGVYLINPETGEIDMHYMQQHDGDGDVNGLAVDGEKLFFGDDHGVFYCYKWNDPMWTYDLKIGPDGDDYGDIETDPVLADLNGDGNKDVVFVAENQGIYALDGETGKEIWKHQAIDQKYNAYGLNSPMLLDCNEDGIKDVVWGTRTNERFKGEQATWSSYGDWLVVLDGKNGKELWKFPTYSAIHASPQVFEYENEDYIVLTAVYSTIFILDKKGNEVASWANSIPEHGGISAFFSTPSINQDHVAVMGTSWWGERDGIWSVNLKLVLEEPGMEGTDAFVNAGKVSASAVVGDVLKSEKGNEFIIPSESGRLYIFSEAGKLLRELRLPSGSETTPMLYDIDGDRKLELLVACYDGFLYCYETNMKSKKKRLEISWFRN